MMGDDEAQTIALQALAFFAADRDGMGAFCDLTGFDATELSARAGDRDVLASVLDALLADESALLVFATENNIPPERIYPARIKLSGTYQTSI